MRRTPFHALFVTVALALSCSPTVTGRGKGEVGDQPSVRGPSGTPLAQLEAVDNKLDEAITQCRCFDCISGQPWWHSFRSLDASGLEAVRELVVHEKRPRICALAIRWLAVAGHIEDIAVIERFVDSNEPAWRWPVPVSLQRTVFPCHPIQGTRTLTVGHVALEALGGMTGNHFESAREYRAWRDVHPSPADSLSYWLQRASCTPGNGCLGAITELGNRNAALLIRVTVTLWHRGAAPVPTIEQIAPILRAHYGQDRLLTNLRDPSSWQADRDSRHTKEADWRVFAIWALSNAEALFEPAQSDAIVALTTLDTVVRNPEVLGYAAIAAGRFKPAARDKIMDDALARLSRPPSPFAQELARYRPRHSAVRQWFMDDEDRKSDNPFYWERPLSEATARGLLSSGKEGVAMARALAQDPGSHMMDRPAVIRALVDGAMARGATDAEFACREDLFHECFKTPRDECQRQKSTEPLARRTCLTAFDRWASRL